MVFCAFQIYKIETLLRQQNVCLGGRALESMGHCRAGTKCYQSVILSHLPRPLCYINPLWLHQLCHIYSEKMYSKNPSLPKVAHWSWVWLLRELLSARSDVFLSVTAAFSLPPFLSISYLLTEQSPCRGIKAEQQPHSASMATFWERGGGAAWWSWPTFSLHLLRRNF